MTATRAPSQAQYLRLPTTAFSNMNIRATSHQVVDLRLGAELGLPPDGVPDPEQCANLRRWVVEVPEHQGLFLAPLYARRPLCLRQALFAERALLHHALGPRRELRVQWLDVRPGIHPVEAAGAVRAGRHAVPAPDAPVPVHHDDAVRPLPGGLGGADAHAGGVVAMIAEHQDGLPPQGVFRVPARLVGEGLVEGLPPDPLDLVGGLWQTGHVVGPVAGGDAIRAALVLQALPGVDDHGRGRLSIRAVCMSWGVKGSNSF